MRTTAFYTVLGIGIILVLGVVWWGLHKKSDTKPVSTTATSTAATASSTPSLAGLTIYTNGQYGFSLDYPQSMSIQSSFDTQYLLPPLWSVDALPNATGTPIIEILGYKTTSANSYPRYFEAEVRVGASADPAEVAACDQPSNGEKQLAPKTINGVTWQAFSFGDEAMMNSLNGISYRTVHDGMCFALEQIETGSVYRDVTPSPNDISQSTLDQHYAALASVVDSFTFARP